VPKRSDLGSIGCGKRIISEFLATLADEDGIITERIRKMKEVENTQKDTGHMTRAVLSHYMKHQTDRARTEHKRE
jgi:hypothetical protein